MNNKYCDVWYFVLWDPYLLKDIVVLDTKHELSQEINIEISMMEKVKKNSEKNISQFSLKHNSMTENVVHHLNKKTKENRLR